MTPQDKDYVLSNLKKENLTLDPFPYFIFNNFFSNDYYEKLLKMKPLDENFQNTDPTRTSNKYALNYRRRFNLAIASWFCRSLKIVTISYTRDTFTYSLRDIERVKMLI